MTKTSAVAAIVILLSAAAACSSSHPLAADAVARPGFSVHVPRHWTESTPATADPTVRLVRVAPAHADGSPRSEYVVRDDEHPTQADMTQAITAYEAVSAQKHVTQRFDAGRSVTIPGGRTAMLVAGQYRAGDSATGRLILTYDLFAIAGAGQPFHLYDEGSKAELGADFVKTFVLSARLR